MSVAHTPETLATLAADAVRRVRLDLTGRVVLTEAATGAYASTAVMAALAGARRVHAWTAGSAHGTVAEVIEQTSALAAALGVADRVTVSARRRPEHVRAADVVTNSGHVRPLDADVVTLMRPGAVVPLMFEAWEVQAGRFDVDLDALRSRGIAVAGTNERHPSVGVFDHLGRMAERALAAAGVPTRGARVAVLCDNPFEPYLRDGLLGAGAASVTPAPRTAELDATESPLDAVLVALRPTGRSVLDTADVAALAARRPAPTVVQFWGDLDREVLAEAGLVVWPAAGPPAGHMAVLPSDAGPEPVVRLQAGGLKVAEVLLRAPQHRSAADLEYLDEL